MRNPGDADATGIAAEMYSIYPELFAVYGATASFPDIPVGGQGSSIAPHFDVTMQPDASCGQVLGAGMQVSGNGFDVDTAFTLDVGEYEANLTDTDTPLTIPRGGILYAYVNVPESFNLLEVDVTVDLDINDNANLDVLLNSPGAVGPPVYLHNNTGAGQSGISTTYNDLTQPDGPGVMEDFIGRDPQGNWSLKITNTGNKNGTLNEFTLHLKGATPWDCNPVGCGEPVPNPVGDNLTVDKSGATDVIISWSAAPGASEYNVRRARDGEFRTGTFVGSTASTSLVDTGAQTLPGAHFYLVRSVNSCRWESP
jgi:subtilisin-like proprotein convertase family protein